MFFLPLPRGPHSSCQASPCLSCYIYTIPKHSFSHFNTPLLSCFPGSSVVKNPSANARDSGDTGSIPGSGRFPGEGNGNSLQYSYLGNSMDRREWWATIRRVSKSQTRQSASAAQHMTLPSGEEYIAFCSNKSTLLTWNCDKKSRTPRM